MVGRQPLALMVAQVLPLLTAAMVLEVLDMVFIAHRRELLVAMPQQIQAAAAVALLPALVLLVLQARAATAQRFRFGPITAAAQTMA
jgi:hypothetical protein